MDSHVERIGGRFLAGCRETIKPSSDCMSSVLSFQVFFWACFVDFSCSVYRFIWLRCQYQCKWLTGKNHIWKWSYKVSMETLNPRHSLYRTLSIGSVPPDRKSYGRSRSDLISEWAMFRTSQQKSYIPSVLETYHKKTVIHWVCSIQRRE